MQDGLRTRIEYILIFSTGSICLLIAVLDLTGLLDSNSWVAQRIPTLTLLAVGFIASYLILERQGKINAIANTLEERSEEILRAISRSSTDTIRSLDGVEVLSFVSSAELVTYASKRFRQAKKHINDVTWATSGDARPRTHKDIEAYQEYQKAISEVAKRTSIIWREVVIFRSASHFKQEQERILDPNNIAYNLAYFDLLPPGSPPLKGFAVIDSEEILLSSYQNSVYLAIKHPDIAKYFLTQFDILWENAKKLKQADFVNHTELQKLKAKFSEVQES